MSVEINTTAGKKGPPRHNRDEAWLRDRVIVSPNGCWEWTRNRLPRGYGQFGAKSDDGHRTTYAHRFSYELHHGPIPPGHDVRHACDNPPCVNPDHLSVGTRKDNMQDMVRRGRTGAEKRSKLTADQVSQIRLLHDQGLSNGQIADVYGVCRTNVHHIVTGVTWKAVA